MSTAYTLFSDKLKGDYKAAFDEIEKYRFANLIENEDMDDRMMELIDQLLTAQQSGDDVSRIVGTDMDRFCRDFFGDYNMRSRLENVFGISRNMVWLVFIFTALECLMEVLGKGFSMKSTVDISYIFAGLGCAIAINLMIFLLIRPLMKLFPRVKAGFWTSIPTGVLVVCLVFFVKFGPALSLRLPAWGLLLISGAYLAVYYILKAINNQKLYGSFRAPAKDQLRSRDVIAERSDSQIPILWYNRFKKKNEKLVQSGKAPVTEEAYLAKLSKTYNLKTARLQTLLIFVGLTALALLFYWITRSGGQDTVLDGIIYTAIIVVAEGLLCRVFWKIDKRNSQICDAMMKDLSESGLSYTAYMERKLSDM